MRLRTVLSRAATGGMLTASLLLAAPSSALACTQVYVGRSLTTTGDTYVGRSEDYGPRYAKAFGIQERVENPRFVSFENDSVVGSGFDYTYEGTGYRYTYIRDLPSAWGAEGDADASKVYSEAGTNERGVSVSATLSTSMNDGIEAVDPSVDTGIGEYNLADYILSVSDTARDGVEKLGRIVDEYGSQACNQIVIADNAETWIFSQLSGHQWIALKMADDVASLNPNMGNLQFKVDLDDEQACLHSADLVSLPEENGLLKTYDDGTPNIAATYGEANSGTGQYTRYAQGMAYFGNTLTEGTDYTVNEKGQVNSVANPQFLFTPTITVDTFTAMRSFAACGEQVDSLNANLNSDLYAIGTNRTTESHMFQIRSGLTPDIATIQWEALSRAEFSLFLPSYSALLTEVPEEYYPLWTDVSSEHEGGSQDSVDAALTDEPGRNLDYVMMDINTLAYNNRSSMAEGVRSYLDVLQKQIIAQQDIVDGIMQATAADGRTDLANRAFSRISEQAYAKMKALLDEMRAYVKLGDTSAAFVPSDYDAVAGTVKSPISYASAFVAPTIVDQPVSAQYKKGDTAAPLSVTATVNDGVAGSDDQLTYQWYTVAADGTTQPIDGATSRELAIETSQVGTFSYQAVVTSGTGLTATSDTATVTVAESKDTETEDPDNGTGKNPSDTGNKKPSKPGKGDLPQTGDASLIAIVGTSLAGLSAAGLGIERRRRNR